MPGRRGEASHCQHLEIRQQEENRQYEVPPVKSHGFTTHDRITAFILKSEYNKIIE
jgi:hypothetical protein